MTAPASWVEVDLDAIVHNYRVLSARAGVPVMAVVKADAYGHGAGPVAHALRAAGARWFGVARAEEGVALRREGLDAAILVMGWTPREAVAEALAHGLRLTVFDAESAAAVRAAARRLGLRAAVHVKVDTGMGRLGLPGWDPEAAAAVIAELATAPGLEVEGLFTHLACADDPDPAPTHAQLARLRALLDRLERAGLRPPLVHAANSAGTLRFPEVRFDLVRCGVALYGLDAYPGSAAEAGLRPALRWLARVAQVRALPAGWGVSYGHAFVTPEPMTVAVVAAGYADGFPRALSGRGLVLLRGRAAPVLGRVCMDQLIAGPVDPALRPGEEAVLVGEQGEARLTADEVAARAGTIGYEIVTRIGRRVPRVYRGEHAGREESR